MESQTFNSNHNQMTAIDSVNDAFDAVSRFLAETPVVETQEQAERAKAFLDRAIKELQGAEQSKDIEARPLRQAWLDALERYKAPVERLTKLRHELGARLQAFLDKIEAGRRAEAARLAAEAEAARRSAEEALAAEREAADSASQGEFVDVGDAIAETDIAAREHERASRRADVAKRDANNVRLGGGFGRAVSVRSRMIPVLGDLPDDSDMALAAVKDMWPDAGLHAAILTAARAYKKRTGKWPSGIGEREERSV